jgi:hypothetical protein
MWKILPMPDNFNLKSIKELKSAFEGECESKNCDLISVVLWFGSASLVVSACVAG